MDDLDAKAPRQFPAVPRIQTGVFTLLPAVDDAGKVIPSTWLMPGGKKVTTQRIEEIAADKGWNVTIINRKD